MLYLVIPTKEAERVGLEMSARLTRNGECIVNEKELRSKLGYANMDTAAQNLNGRILSHEEALMLIKSGDWKTELNRTIN